MLLTEAEAAEYAKVSRKTIRRLIAAGRLPASDFGFGGRHLYRIRPEDLDATMKPELSAPARGRRSRAASPGQYVPPFQRATAGGKPSSQPV
jgi:excisionase family DNA binding protein